MIDAYRKFADIETNYRVDTIEYDGIPMWPYIRSTVFHSIYTADTYNIYEKAKENKTNKIRFFCKTVERLVLIRDLIVDIICHNSLELLRSRNKVVVFTNDRNFRCYKGRILDGIFEGVRSCFGEVVPFVSFIRDRRCSAYSSYIDARLPRVLMHLFRASYKRNKLHGKEIIDEIEKKYSIDCNLNRIVKDAIAAKKVYTMVWKKIKPKIVFVSCYYDGYKRCAISAAKEQGIVTIEMQHGVFFEFEPTYYAWKKIQPSPYPDYFFIFGDLFKEIISDCIYDKSNIISVGSCWLDIIQEKRYENDLSWLNTEKDVVVVVGQNVYIDARLIDWCRTIYQRTDQFFFMYVPRDGLQFELNDNFIVCNTDQNVLECIKNASLTVTAWSTCAAESLYYGTPTVLFDVGCGEARAAKQGIYRDITYIQCAENVDRAIKVMNQMLRADRESVRREAERLFKRHHRRQVETAINSVMRDMSAKFRGGKSDE